jgi:hypothetical protein
MTQVRGDFSGHPGKEESGRNKQASWRESFRRLIHERTDHLRELHEVPFRVSFAGAAAVAALADCDDPFFGKHDQELPEITLGLVTTE